MSNSAISDYNLSVAGLKPACGMAFVLAASLSPLVFLSFNFMLRYLLDGAQVFN